MIMKTDTDLHVMQRSTVHGPLPLCLFTLCTFMVAWLLSDKTVVVPQIDPTPKQKMTSP